MCTPPFDAEGAKVTVDQSGALTLRVPGPGREITTYWAGTIHKPDSRIPPEAVANLQQHYYSLR
jgi:hypothetical protein